MDLASLEAAFGQLHDKETSDGYAVIELSAPATARIATDPVGGRHLLFPIAIDRPVREDRQSAGVIVVSRELLVDGKLTKFVDLGCVEPALNHIFTAVALEALAVADGSVAPDERASAVLERWRDLFKSPQRRGLSQSERMGLFGELTLLDELCRKSSHPVSAWAGPAKGRHDFVSDSLDLEVKTTVLRRADSIQIHGLSQLASSDSVKLCLVVYVVEKVPIGGDRLFDIVARLHAAGVDPVALYDRLNAASVSASDLDSDLGRLRVAGRRIYEVGGDFPRLTSSSFVDWPLDGVIDLTYQVDLTRAPAPLSSAAAEAVMASFVDASAP